MNLPELQAAVLQLSLAERGELLELLQSLEQSPAIALEYPRTTSLGIAGSDFDAASSEAVSLHEPRALRPIGLRAQTGLSDASIRESLVPLSDDDLEVAGQRELGFHPVVMTEDLLEPTDPEIIDSFYED